ncbi:Inactive tyrosine-protein kinase transmembrane receptor ROR1 [Acropora cervicornis]|uniref:Inactive tyrosine-protein kinase transmembrane receptor ROR1 n=1 Tax=Acropora cervicornis TaxID=6130 RepID=A0AAD9PVS4_ACRCE|nr:Inactive tyrosine-protein kinase transmembrane receptor ROR1 [Acropora cervicornis]
MERVFSLKDIIQLAANQWITPVFDKPINNETVKEGDRATFKCSTSGIPPPDVTWYRKGKPILRKDGLYMLAKRFHTPFNLADLCEVRNNFHKTKYSVIPTPAPLPNNGSCMKYNGTVCSKMLRGALVFIRSYEKIENIEKKVKDAYIDIQKFKKVSQRCRPYVKPLLCHYHFPSCDTTSSEPKGRQICFEDCEFVRTKICAKEAKIAQTQKLEIVLFPVCASLPRRGTEKGKNCINLEIKAPPVTNHVKTPIRKASSVTGCFTNNGEDFHANVSVTEKGYVCQAWNSTKPHYHILSPEDHPEIEDPPPVQVVSILYTVIPCLVFALLFSSVIIFVCWRCNKQIMYQSVRREMVRFIKDLGEGEFGKLYGGEVVEKVDNLQAIRPIVAKVLRRRTSAICRESFLRHAEIWSKFSHSNVITIIGVCDDAPTTCILYECADYLTLYDYLVDNSPLESPVDDVDDSGNLTYHEQLSIGIQVAAGMNYLSQQNFIHGDLAARNCVVGPRMTIKITDVALTRNPFSSDYLRSANRPPMPVRWMAPEGVLNFRFTVETDIWSFGVLLWEIFTFGSIPHEGYTDKEVTDRIREHVLLPCPSDCPSSVFVLMKECWDILPPSRPRFSTIYSHLCELRCNTNGIEPSLELNLSGESLHVEV